MRLDLPKTMNTRKSFTSNQLTKFVLHGAINAVPMQLIFSSFILFNFILSIFTQGYSSVICCPTDPAK